MADADARRRAEERVRYLLAELDRWDAQYRPLTLNVDADDLRALLAAGPEAKAPVTTPVPWLECLTVISNPIVPQGAILIHPDTLAGKPDALAYRPPDPLPPPAPITPPPPSDAVREAETPGTTRVEGHDEQATDTGRTDDEAKQRNVTGDEAHGQIPEVLGVQPTDGAQADSSTGGVPNSVQILRSRAADGTVAPPSDAVREAAERLWHSLTPPRSTTDDGMLLVRAEDVEAVLRALASSHAAPAKDAVREAAEVVRRLVKAMSRWGADEEEAFDSYNEGRKWLAARGGE